MEPNLYHLRLPPELARAAQQLAAQRKTTVGQILRDLLTAELAHARATVTAPDAAELDQTQLGALFDGARDWADLIDKLKVQGLGVKPAGNGLVLYRLTDGARLIRTGAIGQPYSSLVKRFRASYPGHPHAWMADRVLANERSPQKRLNHVIHDQANGALTRTSPAERV